MSNTITVFIASFIFVRFIFWMGGMDIFERGVDSAMSIIFSFIFGAGLTGFYKEVEKEIKK